MNRKLIITKLKNQIWTALFEDDKIAELHCTSEDDTKKVKLGDVYIGKVKNILTNINAAFVEIKDGLECYYSIEENPCPIFTHKTGKKPLCIGDEILVQISKEALKTKAPTVSSKLNFTGKYAVLTTGDTRVGVSNKLDKEERERLLHIVSPYVSNEYGIIVRTNAKGIEGTALTEELDNLIREYRVLRQVSVTRTCYSCMKSSPKEYLLELRNVYSENLSEIIVEDEELFNEMKVFLEKYQPEDLVKLRIYKDSLLPLHKLYNIEKCIAQAIKEQVWLKSGAYLVIQPTEALTVIDVNTGKFVSKKKDEESVLKVNIEAALEAARQIRLRNLSGIILIDFINMDNDEYMQKLLLILNKELSKDSVTTTLVDVTKLQLVEITRKKVRKPLHELIHA